MAEPSLGGVGISRSLLVVLVWRLRGYGDWLAYP